MLIAGLEKTYAVVGDGIAEFAFSALTIEEVLIEEVKVISDSIEFVDSRFSVEEGSDSNIAKHIKIEKIMISADFNLKFLH